MGHDQNGLPPAQELETFLPQDEKNKGKIVSAQTYNLTKDVKDVESAEFDPFVERKLENPTSNNDTLTHLLKASLGTGILAMPRAFSCAGLINGIFCTILVAVICTHCAYILIKCAHVLYRKTKKTNMSFPEVGEAALENGPEWARKFANPFRSPQQAKPFAQAQAQCIQCDVLNTNICVVNCANGGGGVPYLKKQKRNLLRIFILVSLFATYFGTCSVYTVIMSKNLRQPVTYYLKMKEDDIDIRIFIIAFLLPIIFMVWIRNLKYLAPVSMVANFLMALSLGITFYYLVEDGVNFDKVEFFRHPKHWPEFFSLTIFAMEAIGVVMPLENAMKTPRALLGYCGVLNKGMTGVTFVYIILGFLGYLKFGDKVEAAVTLSLPEGDIAAQIVKIAIALAVYCTFGLQFFVCVDIMWNCIKDKFTKRPDLADYVARTIMATACVLLAVAVPEISPFMGVIGAFCFSLLGLMAPAIIEIITFWDIGFGRFNYIIWKNVLVFIFGMFALVFGTKDAVIEIINAYK